MAGWYAAADAAAAAAAHTAAADGTEAKSSGQDEDGKEFTHPALTADAAVGTAAVDGGIHDMVASVPTTIELRIHMMDDVCVCFICVCVYVSVRQLYTGGSHQQMFLNSTIYFLWI